MFAKTIDEVKQDLIDHLSTIDKTKLNIMDLNCYTAIVKTIDDMMKPDPSEAIFDRTMSMMREGYCNGFKGTKVGVIDG